MENTPKSLRLHLVISGRINAGKSTLFNLISGQDAAITSPERGTTTDVVEKTMELRPLGATVLLDTAGIDDTSLLGSQRKKRTTMAYDRGDAILLVLTPDQWDEPEKSVLTEAKQRNIPLLPIINIKGDTAVSENFLQVLRQETQTAPLIVNAANPAVRAVFLDNLTAALLNVLPETLTTPPLLRDLIPGGSHIVLMTPIDLQAPKGRLILPQIQAIRDALDGECLVTVAKETAFPQIYSRFTTPPDLVVCDSQAVKIMISTTPPEIMQTTFSILMARVKGDLDLLVSGALTIGKLQDHSKVLIAESCTHHAGNDDIGRVKIPGLLSRKTGKKLDFNFVSGADYPTDLDTFDLIVHCGGCMLNRKAMLNRLASARQAGVAITNYGVCISYCSGVLEKVLSPFHDVLKNYGNTLDKHCKKV